MQPSSHWPSKFLGFALVLMVAAWQFRPKISLADPRINVEVSGGWLERVPYEPPNEQKTKWQLSGDSAHSVPGAPSQAALRGVVIQEYPLVGSAPELTAESPNCIYDRQAGVVFSGSNLKVDFQNGKFHLEGAGYLLHQTNSLLVVSNDVHSVLRGETANSTNLVETFITSKSCEFEMRTTNENGQSVYWDSVRVSNPQLELSCAYLTAQIPSPTNAPGQARRIVAETNVVIDFTSTNSETIHATGQRAVYGSGTNQSPTNGVLELTGKPRIELPGGWISADILVLNQGENSIHGDQNVHLHLLRIPSLATMSTNPGSATNSIDVYSEDFDFERGTGTATFRGNVVANDPQFGLHSQLLVADMPAGQNEFAARLKHLVAETNVTIDFLDPRSAQTNHASADRAVYDVSNAEGRTNEWLVLTGNPSLSLSNTLMTADVIKANRTTGEVEGGGHQHSIMTKHPGEIAPLHTEVFSDDFTYSQGTGLSVYDGNVRGYDPAMNFSGRRVAVQLAKPQPGRTNKIENVKAEGGVVFLYAGKGFAPGDITNLNLLQRTLEQTDNPLATFAQNSFKLETRRLLYNYKPGREDLLKRALATELNELILKAGLMRAAQASGVNLSRETSDLAATNPKGVEWVQLNRLILLDAFRGALFRNFEGDLTRGIGDHAVYNYKITNGATNETIELIGSPRIEQTSRVATAEERIITDRTTGFTRFVGHPQFQSRMEGVTTSPMPQPKTKPKAVSPH